MVSHDNMERLTPTVSRVHSEYVWMTYGCFGEFSCLEVTPIGHLDPGLETPPSGCVGSKGPTSTPIVFKNMKKEETR